MENNNCANYERDNKEQITMLEQINKVREFHTKFGINVSNVPQFPKDSGELRISLIKEETKEVSEAIENEPIENIAKELCDLLYVTYGTILDFGLQDKIIECFNEVHRSNMSKLGKNGKPQYREDGKLLKGDNYSPANIKSILESN